MTADVLVAGSVEEEGRVEVSVEEVSAEPASSADVNAEPSICVGIDHCLLIDYSISCEGQVLEACEPGQPVEYQMGEGQWPIQLELAMFDQPAGEKLALNVAAGDHLFGKPDPERVVWIDAEDFPQMPQPGALIEFSLPDSGVTQGQEVTEGQVLSVEDGRVKIDFNHPYCGRDLTVNITIISIL